MARSSGPDAITENNIIAIRTTPPVFSPRLIDFNILFAIQVFFMPV
jgi:hypothetical protein